MTTAALSIAGLKKVYADGFTALKGIDLEVKEGDFFALLGPNGAGKSTTIGIICSLVRKTEGSVKIFGIDVDKDFAAAKRLIGVVPQEFNFSIFEKVGDIIEVQAGFYGLSLREGAVNTEKYLKRLGLWDKRNAQARYLSGGMKRRLMIARALVHEPQLLILDEPTAGVDIEIRRSMWAFLEEMNRAGTTIILTTHYLEEAESLCRNIAIIDHGEIVENTSMRALLGQLTTETFVVDLAEPVEAAPEVPGFAFRKVDAQRLELDLTRGQHLNAAFAALDGAGLKVMSLRNKSNRLEQLFVSLTASEGSAETLVHG
ncbi:MAG: ABC transporter ATP-binding protein [Pseudomonadota bacterium]|nr:ABC transporter ATP-binding protein [Pseudomonadota bacterium]MED5443721.1 ABC transporter ATP-binding protein [Pseudomonadota bacterium]MEE3108702.1 ABC transporter ATP-binding protein [Pseudomonadota bacterium]